MTTFGIMIVKNEPQKKKKKDKRISVANLETSSSVDNTITYLGHSCAGR